MRDLLGKVSTWIGVVVLVVGSVLVVQENPKILYLIALAAVGILVLTAWYDYDHWRAKFLRWKHSVLLSSAADLVDPHIDRLAQEMGRTLEWDGRSDYLWGPWIERSQQFVDTVVIPALSAQQRRIVARCDPVLREEIRSAASGRIFTRAQEMGLVQ